MWAGEYGVDEGNDATRLKNWVLAMTKAASASDGQNLLRQMAAAVPAFDELLIDKNIGSSLLKAALIATYTTIESVEFSRQAK